jgi:hypothetical protein
MLKTTDFMQTHPDWRELLAAAPYCLSIKDDGGFTLLKYSQIDSDFHNELVRECRGLIVDSELKPVCVPFFKFGNYGEPYADAIDWMTARVEEKIDGSLIKVWNYGGTWMVSTNGTIFAHKTLLGGEDEAGIPLNTGSYGELFEAAAEKAGLDYNKLNPNYTYMFELVSPYNRVVVPYEETAIYHIGTRDNASLREMEIDIGIQKPRTYDCASLDDLIAMAEQLRYCEEGYVVRDKDYKRIKVKSPAYVAVHHLISGLNEKRLLELMRTNEVAEFLSYFPEYTPHVEGLQAKIAAVTAYLDEIIATKVAGAAYETRKDYAMMATQTKYPAFLFQYYDGKVKSPAEWLWSLTNDKILEQMAHMERGER